MNSVSFFDSPLACLIASTSDVLDGSSSRSERQKVRFAWSHSFAGGQTVGVELPGKLLLIDLRVNDFSDGRSKF
jgi:hypothetical protein